MTAAKQAIFRVDASPMIGAGHVVRCLALADLLSSQGWQCHVAHLEPSLPFLGRSEHTSILLKEGLSAEDEAAFLTERFQPGQVDLAVIDHYGRGAEFEAPMRAFSRLVLSLDDFPHREHDCDILLDPTLGRQPESYAGLVPPAAGLLTGPRFALLRPQFAAVRAKASERRQLCQRPSRILVSLGGGQATGCLLDVLRGIASAKIKFALDIVLGGAEGDRQVVERWLRQLRLEAKLHIATDKMAELMLEADIGIGASGGTSWERCCLGLPSLQIVLADNQTDIALALEQSGAAINLPPQEPELAPAIASALRALFEDPQAYGAMSTMAFDICDGLGAGRVMREIEAFLS